MLRLFLWCLYFLSGFIKREKTIYGTYYNNIYSNSFSLYLKQNNGKFICRDPKYFNNNAVGIYSLTSIYYHLTARNAYVDYSHQDLLWFLLRGVKVVNLWHGMPIKKIERDIDSGGLQSKYSSSSISAIINRLKYHPSTFLKYSWVLVNSELHLELLSNAFKTEKVKLGPAPRLNLWHKKSSNKKTIWFIYTFLDNGCVPEHLISSIDAGSKKHGYTINSVLHPKDVKIYNQFKDKKNIFLGLDVRRVGKNDIIVSEQSSLIFDAAAKGLNIVLLKSKQLRGSYFNVMNYFKPWAIVNSPKEVFDVIPKLNEEKSNYLQEKIKLQCS